MATTALQKFLDQLSKNKNVQNVVNEFSRLSDELKKRGTDLNSRWSESKDKTLQQAQEKYQQILKTVSTTQDQLDREVNKAVEKIRSSAKDVEKNLEYYKKQAVAQKAKIEKMLKSNQASAKKTSKKAKTSAKKTVKKAARKTSAKKATQ